MSTRWTWIVVLLLTAATLAFSAFAFPNLPERIPSHWNAAGEADGYSSRWFGVLFVPALQVIFALLLMAVPLLDPLRANIAQFRPQYNLLVAAMTAYFAYLHGVTLGIALGWPINILSALAPGMGGLFYLIGALLKTAKRNWTMGIRTPWTLSSDAVWDKTHALGSRLFRAAGLVIGASILVPQWMIWILLVAMFGATVWTVVYSYVEYRKEERAAGKPSESR